MATPVQLVFTGELLEGFERGEVARQLGQWLGLDDAKAAKLFTGARIVLKRSIEPEDAQRYVARFAKAGARLHIEPIGPPAAGAARPPQTRPQADAAATGAQGMASAPKPAPAVNPAFAALAPAAEAMDKPSPPLGDAEIVCPNCGERQPKRELCRACATNMPMGIAAKIEAEQAAREARKAAFDARRGVRPAAAAQAAGDAVPIWGFGFEGRMGRLTYATAGAMAIAPLFLLLNFALKSPSASRIVLFVLAALVVGLLSVRWSILRLHDLDRSGWWSLLMAVPSLNAGVGLILSLWPGTKDDNDYGEVPAEGSWRAFWLSALAAVVCLAFTFSTVWTYMQQEAESDEAEQVSREEGPGPGPANAPPAAIRFPDAESDAVLAARAAFNGEYAQARGHKAFALSSSGAWGMKSGAASPEEAMAGALTSCDAQRAPDSAPCKTINLNGQGSRSP
jgi:uncharacterized membrane protein YhaH (DUF805 family)